MYYVISMGKKDQFDDWFNEDHDIILPPEEPEDDVDEIFGEDYNSDRKQ